MSKQFEEGVMYRDGNTIYSVMHHGWRKGVEQFRNRIAIHVVFDPAVEHEEREHVLSSIAAAPDLHRQRNELLEALERMVLYFSPMEVENKKEWKDWKNRQRNAINIAQQAIDNCKTEEK